MQQDHKVPGSIPTDATSLCSPSSYSLGTRLSQQEWPGDWEFSTRGDWAQRCSMNQGITVLSEVLYRWLSGIKKWFSSTFDNKQENKSDKGNVTPELSCWLSESGSELELVIMPTMILDSLYNRGKKRNCKYQNDVLFWEGDFLKTWPNPNWGPCHITTGQLYYFCRQLTSQIQYRYLPLVCLEHDVFEILCKFSFWNVSSFYSSHHKNTMPFPHHHRFYQWGIFQVYECLLLTSTGSKSQPTYSWTCALVFIEIKMLSAQAREQGALELAAGNCWPLLADAKNPWITFLSEVLESDFFMPLRHLCCQDDQHRWQSGIRKRLSSTSDIIWKAPFICMVLCSKIKNQ